MKHAHITVDLGFGDAGKGSIVDALVREYNSKLVVRYNGGCQAAHNVVTPEGKHHTFHQIGSGHLAGADTFLSKYALVNPITMLIESEALRKKGFPGALDKVYVDERALVTTPYHRAMNRLREMSRATDRHGSCGMGIGETMSFAIAYPNMALRVADLKQETALLTKLNFLRVKLAEEASKLLFIVVTDDVANELSTFDESTLERCYSEYKLWLQCAHVLDEKQVNALINGTPNLVFEGAQGVLLDESFGFHPYTTWSTTTSENARKILREADYGGTKTEIGIIRTFATRHGAGPFVTEDSALTTSLKDTYNGTNPWQREFRSGWLDIPMLRYALDVCHRTVNTLAVTHVDYLTKLPEWQVCMDYLRDDGSVYRLKKLEHPDLVAQGKVTEELLGIKQYRREAVKDEDVLSFIETHLELPISIISNGPASSDKLFVGRTCLV